MLDQDRDRLQQAEEAFQSFRRRRGSGAEADFEAFCARNPALEKDLRFLNSVYILGLEAASTASFRDILRKKGGDDAFLHFALDPEGETAAAAEAGPGQQGQRYIRTGDIGHGGMSKILRVQDRELNRTLAMKVLLGSGRDAPPAGGSSPGQEMIERLLEEAQLTAQLDHPGIVPVHDVGFDRDGRAYFTMRLVKGTEFGEVIHWARGNERGWSRSRALEILLRVCETVAFAHAKGVVHRDLKPSNIMVGSFGEVYVMDWGIAKILGREDRHAARLSFASPQTLTTVTSRRTGLSSEDPEDPLATPDGTVVGTPVFMPPEQAEGRVNEVNPTSDVYAIGAVLYTLLAGRAPYVPAGGKASPLSILGKVIEGPPRPILELEPTAPRGLVDVCQKAMARLQSDRYRDANQLASELRRCLEQDGARSAWWRALAGSQGATRVSLGFVALFVSIGIALVVLALVGRSTPLDEVAVLAELQRLEELESEAERLWPAVSAGAGDLRDWLERAAMLSRRAPGYHALLATADGEETTQRSLHKSLRRLVDRLDAFLAPDPFRGTVAGIQRRLELVRTVRQKTIEDEPARVRWQQAIASVKDENECPHYAGFILEPQEGFIPLGPDPASGLWEFGHLETGEVPLRKTSGELAVGPESGLILVLVPDTASKRPFLLSKYEMTRGQWRRLTGNFPGGDPGPPGDPVTGVGWDECERVLRRAGLMLPTIAQWKHTAGPVGERSVSPSTPGKFGLHRAGEPAVRPAKILAAESPSNNQSRPHKGTQRRRRPAPVRRRGGGGRRRRPMWGRSSLPHEQGNSEPERFLLRL